MTDYSTQYSPAQLTPINPSQNYSSPLEVNSSYNYNLANPAKNVKYQTTFFCFGIVHPIVFSLVGLGLTVFIILEGMRNSDPPVYVSFFTFLFFIVGYTIGSFIPLCTKIYTDNYVGIIGITKVKTFFWFNESKKIPINEIQKVEKNKSTLNFIFLNGSKIEGYTFQKRKECDEAFNIIRNGLPQNIIFISNDDFATY